MKITKNNLDSHLKESLENIYVINCTESILIDECLESIYAKAKELNFREKDTYIIDARTNWDFLTSDSTNLDLFGSKRIIEIKLIESGPGTKGSNLLKEYSKKPEPNTLLTVIVQPEKRYPNKYIRSAWIKALEVNGVLTDIRDMSLGSATIWISNKSREQNINITREAANFLAQQTEGNLMASLQELRKLPLLYPSEEIDIEKIKKSIANSSKYTIWDFSNAFIARNNKRAVHILESLKAEGTPEPLILIALSKELQKEFKKSITKEKNKEKILKAFKKIALIDSCIKGLNKQNPWISLRELTLTF
tara:strand:+ start:110 stop:1030 length:921 start_codon:yes stop_codon:yes gene_type:complete